ncbi:MULTISPECIES: GH-E family nuclease [unclassified Nocardia]|uniref:GH-E family nuclease n=1 Tax=unclassified Nocardia TaxID=2637762 RepID=UPI0024A7F81D|nr:MULTISPECIES: GH-E family nuclease [unclassified Nocardia]
MRAGYQHEIALPEDIGFDVTWTPDAAVHQPTVDAYVNGLAKPGWYTDPNHLRASRDTRIWMLSHREFRPVADPWNPQRQLRIFLCESCRNGVSESGVELGHIRRWRDHLKYAAVATPAEAKAAYNDLGNLRLECRSCNASHDWE